jgi:hypothetical protein
MGSQPQPQQQAPAKQPQSRPSAPAVGNGSTPQSRPIQSFGGLDVNNKLTGNSGFAGGRNPGAGIKTSSSPAWQRSAGKNDEGGLNAKGRASYNNATGGHLKAPVTESNPKGDRAKRQNSFCSRMCGMKKHETGSKTKKDPDSRINKSLRKWNCKCSSVNGLVEMLRNSRFATDSENGSNLKTSSVGFGAQQQMPQQESNSPGVAQRIGNAINTVDRGTGLGWGTLGGAVTMPAGLTAQGYLKAVNPHIENTIDTPEWQKLMQYIQTNHPELDITTTQKIRHTGRSALSGVRQELASNAASRGGIKNWLLNWVLNNQKKNVEMIGKQPGFYNPGAEGITRPSIAYNTRFKTPGILAHELGHHTGGKLMARANQFGRVASGIGTLGALTATDENTSRNRAMTGSASFLPTLISEFDASRRGAQIMKNLKLPGRMKAFVGLPTYAIMAGAPMLAHYGKKYLGGFTQNPQSR